MAQQEQAFTRTPSNILERADSTWKSITMGDPTKVLILAPIVLHTIFRENSAGLGAAIQALYESNDGPITASSRNDYQI